MTSDIRNSRRPRLNFFVGVNTGFLASGEPDQRFVDFYEARSSELLHCAIVGNVVIRGGYASNSNTPTISGAKAWQDIAKKITARGSLPGLQLATAWDGYSGARSFKARDADASMADCFAQARLFRKEHVSKLFESIRVSTSIAIDAGFKHLQLHAAHGYLLSLLIDPRIYAEAGEVRERLLEWITTTRSSQVETSVRFSLRTGSLRFDESGSERFQDSIATLPADFIDVSSGFYNIDKRLIYPARPDVLNSRRNETIALAARHSDAQFIFSGRALVSRTDDLPSNIHIGLCRDLIANPNYLSQQSNGCQNTGKCHYYSRGEAHISCSQWKID